MAALSYQITYLPVGYSFREQRHSQLNGWTLCSADDGQGYIERAENCRVVAASTVAGSRRLCSRYLKLQMLSGLMGSYHPLQTCAFLRFMDLPAHMKLRWHSAPYKRIVTTVLSAPAAICHAATSQMRMAASGGTRLTHPKGLGEPDARDGLERGGLTPYVVRPPIGSQVGTRFVQEANPVLKTP